MGKTMRPRCLAVPVSDPLSIYRHHLPPVSRTARLRLMASSWSRTMRGAAMRGAAWRSSPPRCSRASALRPRSRGRRGERRSSSCTPRRAKAPGSTPAPCTCTCAGTGLVRAAWRQQQLQQQGSHDASARLPQGGPAGVGGAASRPPGALSRPLTGGRGRAAATASVIAAAEAAAAKRRLLLPRPVRPLKGRRPPKRASQQASSKQAARSNAPRPFPRRSGAPPLPLLCV